MNQRLPSIDKHGLYQSVRFPDFEVTWAGGLPIVPRHFLEHVTLGTFATQVLTVPMEASDANLVRDRWLLVVMPDEVRKYDVALLHQSALPPGEVPVTQTRTLTPHWEVHGIAQMMDHHLATAV